MKYTVVIRQPVPEAILGELTRELSKQFELTADQAAKLASRRSGRLMKPTTRKRAERLMQVFQSVGAQVTLEEVREDTTMLKDPFAAERPGLVGTATLPVPQVDTSPYAPAGTSAFPQGDLLAGSPSPYGSGPLLPGDVSFTGLPGDANFTGTPSVTQTEWGSTAVATLPTQGWDAGLLPSDPLPTPEPFVQRDADLVTPEHVPSGVPEMNLGGLLGTSRPASTPDLPDDITALTPLPDNVYGLSGATYPSSAPLPTVTSEPITDDAWADFTGSLNSAPANSTSTPEVNNPTSIMTVETEADAKPARRSSLSRRVLLSTLLPLGLFTLLTLGFLVYALPNAQRQLITQNAQAVAVAVGSNLDVTDQNTVYAQLDALIKRSSVGFVQVNLPDGTTFFRSKNAYTDGPLSEQIAAWVQQHPDNSTFVQSGSPADSYRYQLALLEQVGAGDSDQAKALKQSVANPDNQKSTTVTYLLSSINVTQNAQGDRAVGQGIKAASGTPLYSIVVGVPGDAAFALLRNTLLLVLGVALLAFMLAALLAARTARLVVQPIERLVRAADAISMGDLDRPVTVERNDEIGDLAQALERMRLSLEAAMERLRRRRKGV